MWEYREHVGVLELFRVCVSYTREEERSRVEQSKLGLGMSTLNKD